jgi:hypothetical protein
MKEKGFTQKGLASISSTKSVSVSQQVIQHLLSGRNTTSKHLPAIADALGARLEWLATGKGSREIEQRFEPLLVGKVGAGAQIVRFDTGTVLGGVDIGVWEKYPNVAEIEGFSQHPLQPGWRVFYAQEHQGIPEGCVGKLCVVQVKNGPTLLKTLRRGAKKNLWNLDSWNEPTRENQPVEWAAPVGFIQPR